jgi:hypothetical protein
LGEFPAEAFRLTASTAYDGADRMFACHQSPPERATTCAGYLLRGADHSIAARVAILAGRIDLDQVDDGGHELYESYQAMAVANGVAVEDPVLELCRDPGYT